MNSIAFLRQFNFSSKSFLVALIFIFIGFATVWGLSIVLPPAVDWHTAFRPASLSLIEGRSPYEVEGFFNPIWALFPLLPIAILPEQVGRSVLFLLTLVALSYTARKMGAKSWAVLLILLSPPAVHGYLNGNIDSLALLGLIFPPSIGLFFVTIKPQIGIGIALFWAFEAWRDGGLRRVMGTFLPVTVAFILSLILFGPWPLRSQQEIDLWWNASFWPASIPIGIALMGFAFYKMNIRFAMSASPCLSPYILFHSWIILFFAVAHSLPKLLLAFLGLWAMIIVRLITGH